MSLLDDYLDALEAELDTRLTIWNWSDDFATDDEFDAYLAWAATQPDLPADEAEAMDAFERHLTNTQKAAA